MNIRRFFKYNIIVLILFLLSCQKEDIFRDNPIYIKCPEDINLGDIYTLESSHNIIPYMDVIEKIVFSDSVGNKVFADYFPIPCGGGPNPNYVELNCEHNQTQTYRYLFNSEIRGACILLQEIGILLELELSVLVETGSQYLLDPSDTIFFVDFLDIGIDHEILSSSNQAPQTVLRLIVDSRNHAITQNSKPNSDSYCLHGTEFFDVYYNEIETTQGNFKILYNVEKGIIGIENQEQLISLKYEYVE